MGKYIYQRLKDRNETDADLPLPLTSVQPRKRSLLYLLVVLLSISHICTWFASRWQARTERSSSNNGRSQYGRYFLGDYCTQF